MKYKRYERYKDSGVEWIGEIPEEWKVCKWRYITKVLTDYTANGSFKDLADNVDYLDYKDYARLIRLTDLREGLKNENGVYVSRESYEFLSKSSLMGGEFLIANVGAYSGLIMQMPKVAYKATLGPNMMMAKFDKKIIDNKFMLYLGQSNNIQKQLKVKANSSSAQPKLNKEDFRSIVFALPNLNEQKAIANFLDQKTAEIDDLIADKEKLIELLKEKRQAIITEAVTKGLNPNVGMKDSGVEWIGEIPEHWDIVPLKHITNFVSRGNSPEYVEESSIKVINQACIYWDELKTENVKYQKDDIEFDKLKGKLIKGDLLLNSTGTGTLGRAVVFRKDGKYMADSHVTIIRFNKTRMNEVLAFYLLQTKIYQGYIYNALITGATNQIELSRDRLTGIPMIVPPNTEQQEIVNFLNSKSEQIDILINEVKTQIQKLKEYRQSLISEAVTGKIDVREFAEKGEVI